MQPTYEVTNTNILSVIQTHDGSLEVVKEYTLDVPIKKKEIYKAIDGRIELVKVEDVI